MMDVAATALTLLGGAIGLVMFAIVVVFIVGFAGFGIVAGMLWLTGYSLQCVLEPREQFGKLFKRGKTDD